MHYRAILLGTVVILAACLVALLGAVSVQADVTFTVDDTVDALDANPGDGACATVGGTCTLRAAIMEANALAGEDTVILPSGVYTLTIGGSGEDMATLGDLDITDDLTLTGTGAASNIIRGDGSVFNDRLVHIVGPNVKAVIAGVMMQNGKGSGILNAGKLTLVDAIVAENAGSGVEVNGGCVLTMTNTTVSDNGGHGVALWQAHWSEPRTQGRLADCTVSGNTDSGIDVSWRSVLEVRNSTISANRDSGIVLRGHEATLVDSIVRDNTSVGNGGGIEILSSAELTVTNSTICGNSAGDDETDPSHGGGIYNSYRGNLKIANSTVCSNTATGHGAGIFNGREGILHLADTTISGNTTMGQGAGVFNGEDGTLYLVDITISGNTAGGSGGGIAHTGNSMDLNNITLTGNTADADADGSGDGGGLYDIGDHACNIANSIIAGNTDNSLGAKHPDCSGTLISLGYNLIQDTTGCFIGGDTTGHLTGMDALVDALEDNGGSTLTHALLAGSPAINAGNPTGCTDHQGNPLLTDQRGRPRIGRCDMGAYEVMPLHFSSKTASVAVAEPGDALTYTTTLRNVEAVDITSVQVTDTVPISVTFVDNSLTATSGSYGYANRVISWTGSVTATGNVIITFGATVSQTARLGNSITNTSVISGGGEIISRTATVFVGHQIYLPLATKGGG